MSRSDYRRGRYSKVSRRVWNDERFRALSAPAPNAQTVWLRLLTGPELTNIPGLFSAWPAGIAQALGWDTEAFTEAFAEVFAKGMAKADWKAGVVWVPRTAEYNRPESPNVVRSWATAWEEIPECALKEEAYRELRAFLEGLGKAFAEAFEEACRDPSPNQYQYQYQYQDQKIRNARGREAEPESDPGHSALPSSGALPRGVVSFERPAWVAAYTRAVVSAGGPVDWSFPQKAFGALQSVVEALCVGVDRQAIDAWIAREVGAFVTGVRAAGEDPKYWSAYGPDGWQRWRNEGRASGRRPESATLPYHRPAPPLEMSAEVKDRLAAAKAKRLPAAPRSAETRPQEPGATQVPPEPPGRSRTPTAAIANFPRLASQKSPEERQREIDRQLTEVNRAIASGEIPA